MVLSVLTLLALQAHSADVNDVAKPRGSRGLVITISHDNNIIIDQLEKKKGDTPKVIRTLSESTLCSDVRGNTLVVSGYGNKNDAVYVYKLPEASLVRSIKMSASPYGLSLNDDGSKVAVILESGVACTCSLDTGACEEWPAHKGMGYGIQWKNDIIATTGYEENMYRLWNASSFEVLGQIASPRTRPMFIALHPFESLAYIGHGSSTDDDLVRWNIAAGTADVMVGGHRLWVRGIAISSDGELFASTDDAGTVIVWDAISGDKLWSVKREKPCWGVAIHKGVVYAAAFGLRTISYDATNGDVIRKYSKALSYASGVSVYTERSVPLKEKQGKTTTAAPSTIDVPITNDAVKDEL